MASIKWLHHNISEILEWTNLFLKAIYMINKLSSQTVKCILKLLYTKRTMTKKRIYALYSPSQKRKKTNSGSRTVFLCKLKIRMHDSFMLLFDNQNIQLTKWEESYFKVSKHDAHNSQQI